MWRQTILYALCGALLMRAEAQAPAADEPLEEVVVTGEFPGPGMWRVTRAGDAAGHELWIVGDPPPLPKRMKWKSRDVEAVALRAQEILLDASVRMDPDEKIGLFRGLSLLPAALKARKNPDETSLKEQLPPRTLRPLAGAEEALPGRRFRRRALASDLRRGQIAARSLR